jgi:hypothetical protein
MSLHIKDSHMLLYNQKYDYSSIQTSLRICYSCSYLWTEGCSFIERWYGNSELRSRDGSKVGHRYISRIYRSSS